MGARPSSFAKGRTHVISHTYELSALAAGLLDRMWFTKHPLQSGERKNDNEGLHPLERGTSGEPKPIGARQLVNSTPKGRKS